MESRTEDKIQNATVLITGGAGFIGSNLCEDLLKFNNKVVCLDNISTGFKKNIEELFSNSNFKFIEGDITNLETCQNACKNVDYVLHQAALGSVPRSIENPIATNHTNIDGFLNMLVAARDNKVKRFVYAASSSTYGDSTELPKIEENIGNPLSPYAITKYVNELYAKIFHQQYQLETVGLRYFNVFGPKQSPNGAYAAVIPKFVDSLLKMESPTINGDGTNTRDFTFIKNVIEMNHLAAVSSNEKICGEVFNTATGSRISLNDLFENIRSLLSIYHPEISEIEVKYGEPRPGDIPHSHASIEKARNLLNYTPSFSVKEGLEAAMEWYNSNL